MTTKDEQKRHRAELVAALRSGKYKQGRRWLRQRQCGEDLYCALGVASDVAGTRWQQTTGLFGVEVGYVNEESSSVLSQAAREYFGFRTIVGEYRCNDRNASVPDLNDNGLLTLEGFADLIEAEPPGLFEEEE